MNTELVQSTKLDQRMLKAIADFFAEGVIICSKQTAEKYGTPYDHEVWLKTVLQWNKYMGMLNGQRTA